jgi:5'-nucleotidase / UDP-sugar diphosphatase
MKKVSLFFLLLVLVFSLEGQSEKKITILHTNDLHSRLAGYAPESNYTPLTTNDDKTIGGFARIAAIIESEKKNNPGISIAVDGGDFLMGTLFHAMEVEMGFQLRLMKEMGYDVVCIGNHEFDFGPEKLATLISNSARSGEIPALILGNIVFSEKDVRDDALKTLFTDELISRKYVLIKDDIKIGFFSILGKDAVNVAPNAAPITFKKRTTFAKKMVKELQNEKCDVVICISHSGLSKNKDGDWVGEDYELANNVKGIDVIISGHTHTKLDKPLIVNGIPIVQTGSYGMFVGKLSLTYSDKKISVDGYELIPVDDKISGDKIISQKIEKQKDLISSKLLKPLGMDYDKPVVESDFILECDEWGNIEGSNLGPMIADAIHFYVNSNINNGTDVSMVAAGMIRDIIVPGAQSVPDIFRVMSLGSGNDEVPGYPLSRLYVTGKELKSILEILQVAYKSSLDNYCYYSGIRVEYNPDKGLLRKIKRIDIVQSDGSLVNVDFSKKNKSLYSVTANSYMLDFFGILKKMSFGLINVVPKDINGQKVIDMKMAVIDFNKDKDGIQEGKEWLALIKFLSSMMDKNGNGIPDIDKKYSGPVKSFVKVNTK